MCGIVGYLGSRNSTDVILEGLTRLEYRGYDSAGVSLIENDELEIYKKEGKLNNLKSLLKKKKIQSHRGIGHTRWATHGEVNDFNAHPHATSDYSIVHNGIIENSQELKEFLMKEKHTFNYQSETDSEVFLALLDYYFKKNNNFLHAIGEAFESVRGNSAFVLMNTKENAIYCVKKSAPIVCGLSENITEGFISSDPYALVGFADRIYFPEDNVITKIELSSGETSINFYELHGQESPRYRLQESSKNLEVSKKGQFEHYMLKEVFEQPILIRKLTDFYLNDEIGIEILKKVTKTRPKMIHIMACGTAYYAGLVIKGFLEDINRIPTNVYLASEFRYQNPILNSGDLTIFISQSGETADTLASLELCKVNGVKTLSILNVEGSTLYREVDNNLLIKAGPEIGVASTKAFTQMCLMGFLFSAKLENFSDEQILSETHVLVERIDHILQSTDIIQNVASSIYRHQGFLFTGRGNHFPIALEGALKLKEIAYVHAEGYASGELKHGPIALIDDTMVNVAFCPPNLIDKTISNVQEIKARQGFIVTIGDKSNSELERISDEFIRLDFSNLEFLTGVYSNVISQLLSYYIAKLKGTDIDKPRNLAKSVTVE
ncbi:glutamine--fructose-6-phosphate transaminase (isomerizing) [Bacteriovoracaceae bacterium]|nr:glutamine--fructose-6-phosphate transaminase (isomerizing) [Bacteriovoracaceae bacterium]